MAKDVILIGQVGLRLVTKHMGALDTSPIEFNLASQW